jgi:hypothetical protein
MASEPVASRRAPPFIDPPGYARHRPEETLLYRLIEQHYLALLASRCARSRRPTAAELRTEGVRGISHLLADSITYRVAVGRERAKVFSLQTVPAQGETERVWRGMRECSSRWTLSRDSLPSCPRRLALDVIPRCLGPECGGACCDHAGGAPVLRQSEPHRST